MSHEITKIDRQEGIKQAWHGLTKVVDKIFLAASWLAQWDIHRSVLHVLGNDGNPVATDYCQLTATDDPKIQIGSPVHRETYQPISNKAFLEIVQDAINGIKGATVASVGSVCGRGRVFISAQLEELDSFEAAGRVFNPYLNFFNSHDQSTPFGVTTSNVCVVCSNTMGMNLRLLDGVRSGSNAAREATEKTGAVRIRLKHTKNVALRLENIPELIDGFLGAQAEFKAVMEKLNKESIDTKLVRPLFTGFLMSPDLPKDLSKASKEDLELSTRRANQIYRLVELHSKGAGNRGQTMADAFSAVTDYFTHESSGGDDMHRQYVSSEYGAGQTQKMRAFNLFQSSEAIHDLLTVGQTVMAAN